jgi:hypothetical protein
MKSLALSLLVMCFVGLPTMGQAAPSGPTPKPTLPPKLLQASAVNTSRSNIKNNLVINPGPDGTLYCTAYGKPCTQAQVKALAAAAGKDGGSSTESLTLAKDGRTFLCGTAPCTTKHLAALKAAVARVNKSNMDAVKIAPSPLPK